MIKILDFDAATDEVAQFYIQLPVLWNKGIVTVMIYWTNAAWQKP